MIREVDSKLFPYFQQILKQEFQISYESDTFSKEYIYVENDQIIGLIVYSLIYDRIELNYIYVDNLNRGKGIASKLMLHMIENNDFKNITLEVNINNIAAISLYKKYGFTIAAVRKSYYNGEDGYLMIRE